MLFARKCESNLRLCSQRRYLFLRAVALPPFRPGVGRPRDMRVLVGHVNMAESPSAPLPDGVKPLQFSASRVAEHSPVFGLMFVCANSASYAFRSVRSLRYTVI